MPFSKSSMRGGGSTLSDLTDVIITSPQDGDVLLYDNINNKWINDQLGPSTVSVTLTINGAKEDTISIYDSNNTLVDTCVFGSGSTSGTCNIVIPAKGGQYTFVSSLAKGITNATISNNYAKTISLTGNATQTVNVYPDHAIYWYGNEIISFTAASGGTSDVTMEVTKLTNKLYYRIIPGGSTTHGGAAFYINNTINTSAYTKFKIQFSDCSINTNSPSNANKPINIGFGTTDFGSSTSGTSLGYFNSNASTSTIYEYNVSSYSSMQYLAVGGHCWKSIGSYANNVGISRMWFE